LFCCVPLFFNHIAGLFTKALFCAPTAAAAAAAAFTTAKAILLLLFGRLVLF